MSSTKSKSRTGMNGSFEKTKKGYPVNWSFYATKALKKNRVNIKIDKEQYINGNQSLCFDVKEVDQRHFIWAKPGLFQTYWATPGESYRISFWIKNENCHYKISIGSEKTRGRKEETMIEGKGNIVEWKKFEYQYTVPEDFKSIRFEINIYSPGKIWIDDIRIEGETDKKKRKLWGTWPAMDYLT